MSAVESLPGARAAAAITSSRNVVLSPYVNERFPAWEDLLSAHDVARLTRRPRWVLLGLAALGRFPRRQRFHGREIGWLRTDVLTWLAQDQQTTQCHAGLAIAHRSPAEQQHMFPLGRRSCIARRLRRVHMRTKNGLWNR